MRHALAVLARGVETDFRPALHRHLQVVLVGGEEHRVAVDVAGERGGLLALEVAAGGLVGVGEPARRRDAGGVVEGVTIAGCAFSTPAGPQPCTQVQWTTPATRVTIEGSPALLSSSGGICIGAAGPAGPPQVVASQVRVTGQ